VTNEELYRDMSESERIERDWHEEQRAQARFLAEMHTPFRDGITPEGPQQLELFGEAL